MLRSPSLPLILGALVLLAVCVQHTHQEETSVTTVDVHDHDHTKDVLNGLSMSHVKHKEHHHDEDEEEEEDDEEGHSHAHGHSHVHSGGEGDKGSTLYIWLSATGAIVVISLCGIFGVLVIPLMQRVFYQHLIQFLVALAVGTLAGDALLHLFPHALMTGMELSHEQHEAYHRQAVWRGFTALAALIGFFVLEKVINAGGEWVEQRKRESKRSNLRRASTKREKDVNGGGELTTALTAGPDGNGGTADIMNDLPPVKIQLVRSGHAPSDRVVGEPVCKNKYSNYCVSDAKANGGVVKERLHSQLLKSKSVDTAEDECTVENGCSDAGKEATPPPQQVFSVQQASEGVSSASSAANDVEKVFLHEHEYMHHGHSHAHSHITSKPDSVSSVAWMVIFGDGIHNLADGMAIGAAFAQSYISGLSTSIAVLCHELPHEIGDFAMLLKAGMTVKQAVMYNIISSLLAFFGMVIGLLLGNIESFSAWIFCATAGIFLYVALVDMIPELNSGHAHPTTGEDGSGHAHSHGSESEWVELLLQLLGMSTGVGIMLLIALFEHDLKEALY